MPLLAPSPTEVLKARYGERYRWLLLMALMVGTIASIIPSTSVNVAIPAMSQYFALGQERAQWITSAFMVASTVAMLVTPWMLARCGYRATYAYAVLLLMGGGIAGGCAQHFEVMLLSRVAEGVAAAGAPSSGGSLPLTRACMACTCMSSSRSRRTSCA